MSLLSVLAPLILVGATIAGGAAFLVTSASGNSHDEGSRVGDVLGLHFTWFDSRGRMLASTRPADREHLDSVARDFDGEFLVPTITKPSNYVVNDSLLPVRLDRNASFIFPAPLLGKHVGDQIHVPVIGQFSNFSRTSSFERLRGPFNITSYIEELALANYSTTAEDGTILIDGFLPVRVLDSDGAVRRLEIQVVDGQVYPVRGTAFDAVIRRNPGDDQFWIHLQAENKARFSLENSCGLGRHVLGPGTYRIADVNDTHFQLDVADQRYPQLIGKSLSLRLEIISITRVGDPGGEIKK